MALAPVIAGLDVDVLPLNLRLPPRRLLISDIPTPQVADLDRVLGWEDIGPTTRGKMQQATHPPKIIPTEL